MDFIPSVAQPLLLGFALAFTQPTFERWLLLLVAALLTPGRHTISNLLRTLSPLTSGHPSSYHRVFSHRRWSLWPLGRALARFILEHWVPQGAVYVAGDDTVDEHPGRKVFGKARHRDPVRSSHSFTAYRWGHKWVVLSIVVKFSFATRPWALPVLVALYRSEEWNTKHRRRHKTPATLMRQLLAVLIHWFPQRHFIFSGDGSYGTHELARFAHRHRAHLTLVSRFYPNANLYAPPPAVSGQPKAGRYAIMAGVETLLERLARRYPIALITARPERATRIMLEHLNLSRFFQLAVSAQTAPHTKPYPDPVHWAARALSLAAEDCVMIGDTTVDVLTGKRAGAQTIGVLCGFGQRAELERAGADLIVNHTADLSQILPA